MIREPKDIPKLDTLEGDETPNDDNEPRKYSRREVLGVGVGATAGAILGSAIGDWLRSRGSSSNTNNKVENVSSAEMIDGPERSEKEKPHTLSLLVLTDRIGSGDAEKLENMMQIVMARFRKTTGWAPEWRIQTVATMPGETYTREDIKNEVDLSRDMLSEEEKDGTIFGVIFGENVKIDIGSAGGYASPGEGYFTAGLGANTVAHEAGHMLGLNHPGALSTLITDKQDNIVQRCAFGTIQELLKTGAIQQPIYYGKDSGNNSSGNPDQYTVPTTVMGHKTHDISKYSNPIFSPPEMLYLDKSRQAVVIDHHSLPDPDKKITLSLQKGKLFSALVKLPGDHALREVFPWAKYLCFGPTVEGQAGKGGHVPFDDPKAAPEVRMYIVGEKGNDIASLDIGMFNKIGRNEDGYRDNRVALYADEQLDTLVVAGRNEDSNDPYIQFLPLSGEGGRILGDERRRNKERNDMSVSKK